MKVLNQEIGKQFAIYHGDSCEVLKGIPAHREERSRVM